MSDLTQSALAIWNAALKAVDPVSIISKHISATDLQLRICEERFSADAIDRIVVVGAGKAGSKMAAGIEEQLRETPFFDKLSGWVNVPDSCAQPLERIILHGARPAGVNEPTQNGVDGSKQIHKLISSLGDRDLCLVLISGGGSALLPAPVEGVSLSDKLQLTQQLMRSGLTITQLNTVRKQLSFLKGGGLARSCSAGKLISLIISDVVGDPLSVISSGPTVEDDSTPAQAYEIVKQAIEVKGADIPQSILSYLQDASKHERASSDFSRVTNCLIACNATALEAARFKAKALGFKVLDLGSANEGVAARIGQDLVDLCREARKAKEPTCILSGGEPIVELLPDEAVGKGGRNMELVLAALCKLSAEPSDGIVVLSGGTDGEDGPTDAAGAYCDSSVLERTAELQVEPEEYLRRHASYDFFEKVDALIKTGPTGTNVMDLRICLVE
jgi:hydroxypyruvate reductase